MNSWNTYIVAGEKPFKCTLCNKAYALASKLKKHLLENHKYPQIPGLASPDDSSKSESNLMIVEGMKITLNLQIKIIHCKYNC